MEAMSASTVTRTATFSDLLRSPREVARAAEEGEVTITRRDGEDLVLSTVRAREQDRAGLELAAAIVALAVTDWPASIAGRLAGPFPWVAFLSEPERDSFAAELIEVARACASISDFTRLEITVHAWRSTAEAYAAGVARDGSDLEWLDEPVDVERPL